jgi:polyhydroxyalkanoate synthesis regulator protein
MIKKYSNRRLYCTEQAEYINLGDVADRIRSGQKPLVRYQKDGTDATAEVYAAVIADLVEKGKITAGPLRELIKAALAPAPPAAAAATGPRVAIAT